MTCKTAKTIRAGEEWLHGAINYNQRTATQIRKKRRYSLERNIALLPTATCLPATSTNYAHPKHERKTATWTPKRH